MTFWEIELRELRGKREGWAAARCAGIALLPARRAAAQAGLGCADPGPSGCDRCRKDGLVMKVRNEWET